MNRVLHFVLLSLFLFLVSCDRDNKSNSEPESKPESFIPDDSRTLVSILSSSEYTPHEFISKLGSRSFASIINYFSPQIVELGKTLARIKLETHLPALDRDFANEVGTAASLRMDVRLYCPDVLHSPTTKLTEFLMRLIPCLFIHTRL